jgi:hypothetical protein
VTLQPRASLHLSGGVGMPWARIEQTGKRSNTPTRSTARLDQIFFELVQEVNEKYELQMVRSRPSGSSRTTRRATKNASSAR